MRARFPVFTHRRESAEELRAHTARLLHAATSGRCPIVGARLGVSKARIQNQVAGDCANALELLYRWLDALHEDGVEAEYLDAIARDVAARRGYDLAPRARVVGVAGVIDAVSKAAPEVGEALGAALERAKSPAAKLREVNEALEALQGVKVALEREHAAGAQSA